MRLKELGKGLARLAALVVAVAVPIIIGGVVGFFTGGPLGCIGGALSAGLITAEILKGSDIVNKMKENFSKVREEEPQQNQEEPREKQKQKIELQLQQQLEDAKVLQQQLENEKVLQQQQQKSTQEQPREEQEQSSVSSLVAHLPSNRILEQQQRAKQELVDQQRILEQKVAKEEQKKLHEEQPTPSSTLVVNPNNKQEQEVNNQIHEQSSSRALGINKPPQRQPEKQSSPIINTKSTKGAKLLEDSVVETQSSANNSNLLNRSPNFFVAVNKNSLKKICPTASIKTHKDEKYHEITLNNNTDEKILASASKLVLKSKDPASDALIVAALAIFKATHGDKKPQITIKNDSVLPQWETALKAAGYDPASCIILKSSSTKQKLKTPPISQQEESSQSSMRRTH